MEIPLPWERLLWSSRAVWPPGARYALTDFRLVHVNGRRSAEIASRHARSAPADRGFDHPYRNITIGCMP